MPQGQELPVHLAFPAVDRIVPALDVDAAAEATATKIQMIRAQFESPRPGKR